MKKTQKQHQQQGFTLIELSIVLVIIGLIVGGVLVGQDLIKAAELRATVSQLEKYNTAVNTFRVKYNAIPGDLSNAATFGFEDTGIGTNVGNGLINQGTDDANNVDAEVALFFPHLATASLISENMTGDDGTAASIGAGDEEIYFPTMKVSTGRVVTIGKSGRNYYFLGGIDTTAGESGLAESLTPTEAFQLDSKLDDGVATTGTMQVYSDFATAVTDESAGGMVAGECVNGTAYAAGPTAAGDAVGCALRVRTQF